MVKKQKTDPHGEKLTKENESPDNKTDKVTDKDASSAEMESARNKEDAEKAAGSKEDSGEKKVVNEKTAEEKLAEMQDKYLRLSAEFDNYRKRTLREKMELSKYAGETVLTDILPLIDDFDRAISHMESATDCIAMKEGMDLIYYKLLEFLKQNGVKEIESLNCDFNVDLHHAVAKKETDKKDKGRVVEVIQKGYYLHDKILRHAKVVVGE